VTGQSVRISSLIERQLQPLQFCQRLQLGPQVKRRPSPSFDAAAAAAARGEWKLPSQVTWHATSRDSPTIWTNIRVNPRSPLTIAEFAISSLLFKWTKKKLKDIERCDDLTNMEKCSLHASSRQQTDELQCN